MTDSENTSGLEADRGSTRAHLILAVALACVAYSNILTGDFVYDDSIQIVDNHQIKDSRYFVEALTTDVWSFKGDTGNAWSNYWRPVFVLWLMLNYRLFGLENSFGWHVGNVLLHAGCCVLLYQLLRRLKLQANLAAAITIVFAVHPVHVESVAWISGAMDMLLTLGLLGCLLGLLRILDTGGWQAWLLSLGCYFFALLSKETAILFPCVIFAVALAQQTGPWSAQRMVRAAQTTAPFVIILACYLLLRIRCLGFIQRPQEEMCTIGEMLLSWPSVALFYVRQVVFPFWIGPSYPIRIVTAPTFNEFWLPLMGFVAVGTLMLIAACRSKVSAIGLTLFIFTLAPAMNVRVFTPEQVVHDRYLYLPLAGVLMIVVPFAASLWKRWSGKDEAVVAARMFQVALVLCLPLMVQTLRYNRAWASDVALWEWGVKSDPSSMFNYTQYGVFLAEAGRPDEGLVALDRAIELLPLPEAYQPNAHLKRSELLVEKRRFAEAEQDLRLVLKKYPSDFRAFERLALLFERQGQPEKAEQVLREAREKLPFRVGELTEAIAIVLYQQGKVDEALAELEEHADAARKQPGPKPKMVLYRLALIYGQQGRLEDARRQLQEFLQLTAGAFEPGVRAARADAKQRLGIAG